MRSLRGPATVAEAVAAFERSSLARGLRPKTVRWYREMLKPLLRSGDRLPEDPEELEAVLGGLGEVSDETRHDHFVAMRVFYRWLARRFDVVDAMAKVDRPLRRRRVREALTAPQLRRVLESPLCRRDRALLTLLLDTGIRIGEAHSLTWSTVGEETIAVAGKVGLREVPISSWTRWVLLGVELPWRGARGQLTVEGLGRAVRRCLRRAGVERGGAHLLRHTFARIYLRAGGDVFSLQRILGHRSLSTTRVYAELELGDVIAQHRRFSPITQLLEEAAAG